VDDVEHVLGRQPLQTQAAVYERPPSEVRPVLVGPA
jgi:hypothetical protein